MSRKSAAVRDLELIVPPEESVDGARELSVGGRTFVAETARAFKVAETFRVISRITEYDAAAEALNVMVALVMDKSRNMNDPIIQMGLAYQVLPKLFQIAPELVFDLAAILSLSNAELRDATKQPNGVKEAVSLRKEWLMWEVDAAEVLELVAFFLPTLGLEHLKNAVLPMAARAIPALTGWLGNQMSAPSADSLSSPAASGA